VLIGGLAAGAVLGAGLSWPRIARPPAPEGPLSQAARDLIDAAWDGIDPDRALDCHVHVVGLGTGGTGCWVHPRMRSLAHPLHRARFDIYRRAAGIEDLDRADQEYIERLAELARVGPRHRLLVLAFDHAYNEAGEIDLDASEFFVPSDYVMGLAREHRDVMVPCGSIHPYRRDALAELDRLVDEGVRVIKWLPSAMRIDPASPRCAGFFRRMAERGVTLLTHAGEERAVEVEDAQRLANPLRLRQALDAGVKVVVAHCASAGDGEDLDAAGPEKPLLPNFELFLRMMGNSFYQDRLFGEVSAMVQYNRCEALARIVPSRYLYGRIFNGSDYPLPAINALVRTGALVRLGLISETERTVLNEIDRHNPLLFDFVLKRSLRGPAGERLPPDTFMPPAGLFG
jgi:mannonate dehydratase